MHVIRSRNNQILIDELDLVRVFGLLFTSIFIACSFSENQEPLLWI